MSVEEPLNKYDLPKHLAIIMDGNGRWAKLHGKLRSFGHKSGVQSVKSIVEYSVELGIKYLTLYAFSKENWARPKGEVNALLSLMSGTLEKEISGIVESNTKLCVIGDLNDFPKNLQDKISSVVERTKENTGMVLSIALSYGGQDELQMAMKTIAKKVQKGVLSVGDIDNKTIRNHLYTKYLPDVDLIIRTGGERRLSNFLLWQAAYSELYFTETLWPDFQKEDLIKALRDYKHRERRFGKTNNKTSQNLECQKTQ